MKTNAGNESILEAEAEFLTKLRPWMERLAKDASGTRLEVAQRYMAAANRRIASLKRTVSAARDS